MSDSFVKIVKLPSMKVVAFHSMGEHLGDPEDKALRRMVQWAKPRGLLSDSTKHQVFGFNNPDPPMTNEGGPAPDKPYGYEYWITVGDGFAAAEDVAVKTVKGGLYAVMTCRVEGPVDIGKTWGKLVQWIRESNEYTFHPKWKGLKAHYDSPDVDYGVTGLENHLNILEPAPKGKPWQTTERLVMDIYAPITAR